MSQIHIKIYRSPTVTEFLKYDPSDICIGRGSKNTIQIDDDDISRNHCTMNFDQDRWWVKDLKSTNGTYVNGLPVQERALKVGDAIILGSTRLHIVDPNILAPAEDQSDQDEPIKILKKQAPASAFSWIEQKIKDTDDDEVRDRLTMIQKLKDGWLNIPQLYSLETGMSAKKSINNLAQRILADVIDLISQANFGVLLWYNDHSKTFEVLAEQSEIPGPIEPNFELVEKLAIDKQALQANVLHSHAEVQVIAAPLAHRDVCKGMLYIGRNGWEGSFSSTDLELLCLFAKSVSIAINNLTKIKSLQRQIDSLAANPGQDAMPQILFDADRSSQMNTIIGANVSELERQIKHLHTESKQLKELVAPEHPAHGIIEKIYDELDASRNQCDRLLTFCRRGVVRVPQFNPSQILNEVFDVTRSILGENVLLESDFPDHLPVIEFDVIRFEQIMVQLIAFACNSMPDGGMIRVSAEAYEIKPQRVDNYGSMQAGESLRVMFECTGDIHISDTGKNQTMLSNEDYFKLIQIRDVLDENKGFLATETQLQGGTFVLMYFPKQVSA